MSENILSTLEHDPSLGKGTILFGGSGLLGPYILESYPDMISVGRSPCPNKNRHIHVDSLDDLSALDDVEFDRVIYIIGHTDHYLMEKEDVSRDEPSAFDYHTVPLFRVMEQIKHRDIKKFIHFSSVLIYDEKKLTLPINENSPIDPYKNRYVMSKYLGEELCKFYRNWMPVINCRMSNLYGPTPLERFDLIHRLTHKLLDEGKAEIWSDKPSRDFIYTEDAAHAIVDLIHSDYDGTVVLGSGEMTSVRRVIDIMSEVSGCPITSLDKEVTGPNAFLTDLTTLQKYTDWVPRISIEEGIRRTFEFEKARRGL